MPNVGSKPGHKHEQVPAGTRYPTEAQALRALLCDIVTTLSEDVKQGDEEAAAYLATPAFGWYCDALDLDPAAVRESLLDQAGSERKRTLYRPRAAWRKGPEIHAMYREYVDEGLSVPAIAQRYGIQPTTLYSRFSKMGLPAVNGNPRKRKEDRAA